MARSFTVPATAIRPMSPPGKKIGRTTCESVVKTTFAPLIGTTAPSSRASSPIPPAFECVTRVRTEISSFMTSPPAPCISSTFIRLPPLRAVVMLALSSTSISQDVTTISRPVTTVGSPPQPGQTKRSSPAYPPQAQVMTGATVVISRTVPEKSGSSSTMTEKRNRTCSG